MSFSKAVVPVGGKNSESFGLLCGAAVGSVLVNQYLAFKVMQARKQYDVKYPRLYHADPEHVFNCVQRAHQNYIENQPVFLTLLVVAGMKFPKPAAICGFIYLAGRILYAKGYSTGDPEKRKWGAVGYIGLLPLLGMSVYSVLCQTGLLHKSGAPCCTSAGCC